MKAWFRVLSYDNWPDFSIAADDAFGPRREGFDTFINTHPDRELRNLGDLRVKNILRNEWGCVTGNNARRRNGSSSPVHGIQWPPLQELRAKFVQRHGPQEWLHPEIEEWGQPTEPALGQAIAEPARGTSADAGVLPS